MNIRSIRTLRDLDSVRAHWEQWQSHANNDFAQFKMVCGLRPEVLSPIVTVVEKAGEPEALLAGRLERSTFAPAIAYFRPVRIAAKLLVVIHEGVLGRLDEQAACGVIGHLRSLLRDGLADAVEFHHVPEGSALMQALRCERTWLCERTPRWSTHREMLLPESGSFLEQKVNAKHRSRIRKRAKDLEAAHAGRVAWRWMTEFDDIPALCVRLEDLAAKTYQRGLWAGFFDNEDFRRRLELFAGRKQLRVQTLEIDGRIRAFWFGTVYQGVFHSSETGYDPNLREFEVGTLIFARMVDGLVQERVRRLDFGLGDADYKERFGDRSWRETPAWLFAPTLKGVSLMLILKLSFLLDTTARRVVERAGLTNKLKAILRRRMSKADDTTGTKANDQAAQACHRV